MLPLIRIEIKEEGEHWNKEIRILGVLIYSRYYT